MHKTPVPVLPVYICCITGEVKKGPAVDIVSSFLWHRVGQILSGPPKLCLNQVLVGWWHRETHGGEDGHALLQVQGCTPLLDDVPQTLKQIWRNRDGLRFRPSWWPSEVLLWPLTYLGGSEGPVPSGWVPAAAAPGSAHGWRSAVQSGPWTAWTQTGARCRRCGWRRLGTAGQRSLRYYWSGPSQRGQLSQRRPDSRAGSRPMREEQRRSWSQRPLLE